MVESAIWNWKPLFENLRSTTEFVDNYLLLIAAAKSGSHDIIYSDSNYITMFFRFPTKNLNADVIKHMICDSNISS